MIYCRIREVAEQQGLTITQLAKRAGVSASTVRNLWHNPHHNFKISILDKLVGALQVPIRELISSVPDPTNRHLPL
jgi:transcriptional regulator with XRE-family HTH domain